MFGSLPGRQGLAGGGAPMHPAGGVCEVKVEGQTPGARLAFCQAGSLGLSRDLSDPAHHMSIVKIYKKAKINTSVELYINVEYCWFAKLI